MLGSLRSNKPFNRTGFEEENVAYVDLPPSQRGQELEPVLGVFAEFAVRFGGKSALEWRRELSASQDLSAVPIVRATEVIVSDDQEGADGDRTGVVRADPAVELPVDRRETCSLPWLNLFTIHGRTLCQ